MCVPGMPWLAILLLGRSAPPTLTALKCCTTRGTQARGEATDGDGLAGSVSAGLGTPRAASRGIKGVLAVAFLGACFQRPLRFIVRWHKGTGC